jgi:ketosteroid isomerase-like protein
VGNAVTRGREGVVEAWSGFFNQDGPRIYWRPQFVEVLENGKLALSRGPYKRTSVDEDGNAEERWGTFNSVWRLHPNGKWQVVFDSGSPASKPFTDEVKALLDQADNCKD